MATTSLNGGSAADRISNLPCEITDHILNNLPLRDAVRTSILSREWRYKLATIPHLVFDRDFKQSLHVTCDLESIINHILSLHKGPIVKFSVKDINIKSHPTIHHWLHLLSNHHIEELTLRFSYSLTYYAMPNLLFSFDRLTHLYLANCDIKPPPAFKGFSRLVRLDLISVRFALGEFKRFLSTCPVLEFLNMRSFNGNLVSHLDVYAPKLKSFHFWGKFSSICFGNAALEELSICYSDFVLSEEGILVEDFQMSETLGNDLNLFKIFSRLSSIRRLEFNDRFLQVVNRIFFVLLVTLWSFQGSKLTFIYIMCKVLALGGILEKLPNNLNHLTIVKLSDIDFGNTGEVACALCFIRSSPNLQNLEITSETCDDPAPEAAIQYLKSLQKCKPPISCSLKNVKIRSFSAVEMEVEFIKLLLSAVTVLQKLEIKSAYCGSIGEEGSPQILKELTSFCPSSSKLEILLD